MLNNDISLFLRQALNYGYQISMFQEPLIHKTKIALLAQVSDGLKNEIVYLLGPGLGIRVSGFQY